MLKKIGLGLLVLLVSASMFIGCGNPGDMGEGDDTGPSGAVTTEVAFQSGFFDTRLGAKITKGEVAGIPEIGMGLIVADEDGKIFIEFQNPLLVPSGKKLYIDCDANYWVGGDITFNESKMGTWEGGIQSSTDTQGIFTFSMTGVVNKLELETDNITKIEVR